MIQMCIRDRKLPVYLYGHPVLRKQSTDITPDYPELKKLVADMFETMYASEGVGLAAPQIGRNDRIVVIDADPVGDSFPECAGRKFTLINPVVEVLDGEVCSRAEGCLSLPGLSEDVKRVEHIRPVSYTHLEDYYITAFNEMSDMLAGRDSLSIKRAVYFAEWAYYEGKLDYKTDFCDEIDSCLLYTSRCV